MTINVQEVEATVGALGEEFEELVDDVRNSKRRQNLKSPSVDDRGDQSLEKDLVNILKKYKRTFDIYFYRHGRVCTHKDGIVDLRAADAPPLVLLDRADVLTELRSLKSRTDAVDNQEQEWIAQLIKRLESLSVYILSQ